MVTELSPRSFLAWPRNRAGARCLFVWWRWMPLTSRQAAPRIKITSDRGEDAVQNDVKSPQPLSCWCVWYFFLVFLCVVYCLFVYPGCVCGAVNAAQHRLGGSLAGSLLRLSLLEFGTQLAVETIFDSSPTSSSRRPPTFIRSGLSRTGACTFHRLPVEIAPDTTELRLPPLLR